MAAEKRWTGEAIDIALAAQGIGLAPGRGERLARGQQALLDASASDPLRAALPFDADPSGFSSALERCRAR